MVLYLCSILIHRIDVVPSAPKLPVPVFEFQIPKLLVKHQTTFPFQISHKAGYAHFGRDLHKHMDMICAAFSLQNQYAFPLTLLSKNATYCSTLLSVEHLSSVSGTKLSGPQPSWEFSVHKNRHTVTACRLLYIFKKRKQY